MVVFLNWKRLEPSLPHVLRPNGHLDNVDWKAKPSIRIPKREDPRSTNSLDSGTQNHPCSLVY